MKGEETELAATRGEMAWWIEVEGMKDGGSTTLA